MASEGEVVENTETTEHDRDYVLQIKRPIRVGEIRVAIFAPSASDPDNLCSQWCRNPSSHFFISAALTLNP